MTSTPESGSPACADRLIAEALNKPWRCLGRGPDAYDCWGFCLHILRDGLGWTGAPEFAYAEGLDERAKAFDAGMQELTSGRWLALARPEPYCVMMLGQSRRITHVGLWHPSNTVYHCFEGAGVVGTRVPALRRLGWSHMIPYKHEDMPWLI